MSKPFDDPMIRAVRALTDRSALYFKFAAHYRMPFRVQPHASALMTLLHDNRVVWGSDWPHTQHESSNSYDQVCLMCSDWGDFADRKAVECLSGLSG